MVKHSFILMIIILLFCSAGYAQMTVTDSDDNVLMKVYDEGTTGSIYLPSGSAPFFKPGKLYNQNGALYWSGTALGMAGSAGGWTDNGSVVRLTTATDKVGIGTSSSEFKLNLDNDGGILAKGTYNAGATLSTSGSGSRFIWYPRKAAFRAGYVTGDPWDDENIGRCSMAAGFNTKANGYYSTAMGLRTKAESMMSMAIGRYNVGGGNALSWVPTDPVFEIGIGETASNPANAVTVLKNGNVGIGITDPAFALDVKDSLGINGTRVLYLPDQAILEYNGTLIIGDGGSNLSKTNPAYDWEGGRNTAVGFGALSAITAGYDNTAIGFEALHSTSQGAWNTAIGMSALFKMTCGYQNTAIGQCALSNICCGYHNTAVGYSALSSAQNGDKNTAIGYAADFDSGCDELFNTTAIGFNAKVDASNKVVIGNTDVIQIGGYADWSNYSDRRFKENIEYRDDPGLDFIMRLNTVSFNYIDDANRRRRDGLIAQDVQKALEELGIEFSGLIIDDNDIQTMNLSYGLLVIPLINAVKEQQAMITALRHENEQHFSENTLLKTELAEVKSMVTELCKNRENAHTDRVSLTSR